MAVFPVLTPLYVYDSLFAFATSGIVIFVLIVFTPPDLEIYVLVFPAVALAALLPS